MREPVEKSEVQLLCVRCSPYSVYRISSDRTCVADNIIIHEIEIETVPIIHILYTLSSSIFIRTVRTSCILIFRIQDPCCGPVVWLRRTSTTGAPAPTHNLNEILFFSKGHTTITKMWIFWTSYTVYGIWHQLSSRFTSRSATVLEHDHHILYTGWAACELCRTSCRQHLVNVIVFCIQDKSRSTSMSSLTFGELHDELTGLNEEHDRSIQRYSVYRIFPGFHQADRTRRTHRPVVEKTYTVYGFFPGFHQNSTELQRTHCPR